MIPGIKFEVDDASVRAKINRIRAGIDNKGSSTVSEIGELTKQRARYLAPKDTGKTASFIVNSIVTNSKGYKEAVVGFKQNPYPDKTYSGGVFNLPLWMHTSQKALSFPWRDGGRPRFLYEASSYAQKEFFRRVSTFFQEEIRK